jgi:hypothetical protein
MALSSERDWFCRRGNARPHGGIEQATRIKEPNVFYPFWMINSRNVANYRSGID